jgi:hypothetical protein
MRLKPAFQGFLTATATVFRYRCKCRSLCGPRAHNHAQRGGKVNNRVALKYVETRSNPPRPRAPAPPKSSPTRVFHHHSKSDLPHLPGTKHTLEPVPCTTSFKMATKTEEKPVGMLILPHKLLQIATYIIGQTTRSPTPTRELPSDVPYPSERVKILTHPTASPSTRPPLPSPRRS